MHILGLHRRRRQNRPSQRVGRDAVQVETNGLEAGRVRPVGVHCIGELVRHGELPGRVRIIDVGGVCLRREDRELQRDERRIRRLQSAVDGLVEVHVLLVVVESQPREDAKAIRDEPFELAEGRSTYIPELQKLVDAIAVEQAGRRRSCRRRQEHAPGGRTLLLFDDWIGIDTLTEREEAGDDVQMGIDGTRVSHLLRPLRLLGRPLR